MVFIKYLQRYLSAANILKIYTEVGSIFVMGGKGGSRASPVPVVTHLL